MRSRLTVVAVLFVLTSICFAQAGYRLRMKTAAEYAALQRQIVGAYCRFDFDGARLTDSEWAKMKPLVRFKENADFGVVEVVSRYQVTPPEGQTSNNVTVTYYVLGRYDVGFGYTPAPTTRDVVFRVEEKNDELEITNVDPNFPRVSKRAAVQWLKARMEKSTNSIEKAEMEKAIAALDVPTAGAQPANTNPSPEKK